jgi:two-component system, cell cycle response regulator
VLENTPPPTRLTPPIIPLYDLPVADDWDEDTTATEQSVVTNIDGQAPCLTILTGSSVGQTFKVTKGNALIGRGQEAHVRILDDGVSRQHARLKFDTGGNLYVVDLSSRNGTYVNGKKIGEQIQLQAGDKIQVGRTTVLRFEYQDAIDQSFHENLLSSALRDGLTRLFNKRYFMDRLDAELKFARRHQTVVSLLMLDLDHFKKINDDHGHLAGDNCLRQVADTLRDELRGSDRVFRWGGDEFAVVLADTGELEALEVLARLETLVTRTCARPDESLLHVTCGHATLLDWMSADDLVAAADEALFTRKGRASARPVS